MTGAKFGGYLKDGKYPGVIKLKKYVIRESDSLSGETLGGEPIALRERLRQPAFDLLVGLNGEAGGMPGCFVAVYAHSQDDDREWPDISGNLHGLLCELDRPEGIKHDARSVGGPRPKDKSTSFRLPTMSHCEAPHYPTTQSHHFPPPGPHEGLR
jgi:hypothetical protein